MSKHLLEKDIVNMVVSDWDEHFGKYGVSLFKEEYTFDIPYLGIKRRIDLMGYVKLPNCICKVPMAIECKYYERGSTRDLITELQSLIRIRNYHKKRLKSNPRFFIAVLIDKLDETEKEFMRDNNIVWFKFSLEPDLEVIRIKNF